MKWLNKGHEFDHLIDFFHSNHKYVIWGAGTYGKAFYERMQGYLNILYYIDSDDSKTKELCTGLQVISPQAFFEHRTDEIVIVSTGMTASVYSKLKQYGMKRFVDYFHIDEIESLYMFFEHDKVCISDVTLGITQRCSLKCDYCNAFIPLIEKPVNHSVDYIMEQMDVLMRWVDEINVLGICGGDAMVHPRFREILDSIGEKYYPHRVKNIEIYSNAVIVPSEEDISLFKKYDVVYRFTDYSGNSGRQNIDEVIGVLQSNNIRFDCAKLDSWYDCGYPQESNGITGEDHLISFCDLCDRKTCHNIIDSKFFSCAMCINADIIGYCPYDEYDYFDMGEYDYHQRMEFIEYFLGFSTKGYYSYCKKCNGSANVNTKKIPAGKQITKG